MQLNSEFQKSLVRAEEAKKAFVVVLMDIQEVEDNMGVEDIQVVYCIREEEEYLD